MADDLKIKFKPIIDKFKGLESEVEGLRFNIELPDIHSSIAESYETLIQVRLRLDRIESILVEMSRIRTGVNEVAGAVISRHEDAWDSYVSKSKNASALRGSDFTGPRERYADANLATVETKRDARIASGLMDACGGHIDRVKWMLKGLEGVRQDLLTKIRVSQIESSLER